ncbi:MAG: permease-like cell division protein FtsX [Bacteroidaceae bacterium]|nr:permease-like cell division protein FtsX [Bacteroidaceae bacterium]
MGKKKKKHTIDVQFITACISTSLVLLLLGTVAFFVLTANSLSVYVRENLELSALVHDGTTPAEVDRVVKRIEAQPYAKEVRFISKDEVLQQETALMGVDPTEFLGLNPYTASIEIRLKADYANGDSLAWIGERLRHEACISDISYPSDLVNNLNGNIRKISLVMLVLALALLLISFALINNTIKLTIYSQRFLLHTMKLVGAGWSFIRRPFMVRNFWIGIASGLLALAMMSGGAYALMHYEPRLVELMDVKAVALVAAGVMLFGVLITMICARVSINRFLRMKAGDLYYI